MCPTGKIRHATSRVAWAWIAALPRRIRGRLRAYRCPHCGAWHVTHEKKREKGRSR